MAEDSRATAKNGTYFVESSDGQVRINAFGFVVLEEAVIKTCKGGGKNHLESMNISGRTLPPGLYVPYSEENYGVIQLIEVTSGKINLLKI